MFKRLFLILFACLGLILSGCSAEGSGLQSYVDAASGYQFLYPNGWLQVNVKEASEGVDIVFRDIIERSENLCVIISDVPADKNLTDIGDPTEVGYRFLKQTNNSPDADREIELINAESHQDKNHTYYMLEYQVHSPSEDRHNLASVSVSRGKLYTFNLSTTQPRWEKVKSLFEASASSFTVY